MAKIYDIQPQDPKKMKKITPAAEGAGGLEREVVIRRSAEASQEKHAATPHAQSSKDAFLEKIAAKEKPVPKMQPSKVMDFRPAPALQEGGEGISRKLVLVAVIIGAIFVGGGLVFGAVFSNAKIEITTQKEYLPYAFDLEFRKDVSIADPSRSRYPLEVLRASSTSTKEYAATGEGEVRAHARGFIEVFNEYNSSPQVLVEKTRFLSPDGKLFRITKRITVPGTKTVGGKLVPGSILAEARADQPGPDYNIGPARFTIPGFLGSPRYTKFYGVSHEPFRGGAVGKSKIVTEVDVKKASEDIARTVLDMLRASVAQGLPERMRLIEGASLIEMDRIRASAKAGDAGETFTVEAAGNITALVFDETHVIEKAKALLPQDYLFFKPVLNGFYEPAETSFTAGVLKVGVRGTVDVAKSIDVVELKRGLAGKHESVIRGDILKIPGIQEVKIRFRPFWARKVPKAPAKITVTVK